MKNNITFVSFHIDIDPEKLQILRKIALTYTYYQPEAFLDLMFDSAEQFHPGCKKIILTDLKTPINVNPDIEIKRFPIESTNVMLEIQKTRAAFLKQADPSSHYIFLDSDILLTTNLESLFEKNFDFALTTRDEYPEMPINGGIIFVHKNGIEATIDFFERIEAEMKNIPQKLHHIWYGDQFAMRDLIGPENLEEVKSDLIQVGKWKILLLPCLIYNFSTPPDIPMNAYYPESKVLHFKGPRKVFMMAYWKNYLKSRKANE